MKRRFAVIAAVVLAAVVVTPAGGTPGPPMSIAALGGADSAGPNSWSTGTNPAVRSHRLRLYALTHSIPDQRFQKPIRAFTFATNQYRTVANLPAQARQAAANPVRLVTVDVGVGDVCTNTPFRTFQADFAEAMKILGKRTRTVIDELSPGGVRSVLVLSIENLAEHWRVLRGKSQLGCELGTPARREEIRKRTIALNEIMARACYRITGCLFDVGARFRMPLHASYFSRADPRFLSVEGERALSTAEWRPARTLIDALS